MMFSCFGARKKPQTESKSKKQTDPNVSKPIQPKPHDTIKYAEESTTVIIKESVCDKNVKPKERVENVEELTSKKVVKQNQSVKELSNESGQILNATFSSDADTVPYKNRLEASVVSTARMKKGSQKKIKQFNLYEVKPFRTIGQNEIQHFPIDKSANMFHSRSKFMPVNGPLSNKASASIDYNKYSEHDMQVGSSEILDLDEEMQSKLKLLENSLENEQKQKLTASLNCQKACKKTRFHEAKHSRNHSDFDTVQNDITELERAEDEMQCNRITSSKGLSASHIKGSNKGVKFNSSKEQKENESKNQEADDKQKGNQLVQKTVKSELQVIGESTNTFFCATESLKSPQSLEGFRKLAASSQIPELDETLEQAQNSFHCNSINEEFSRALVRKQYSLALGVFEKMTLGEKNGSDDKGFAPVHLAVLQAVVEDRTFELAKKLMYHPEVRMDVKGPTGWSPLQQTISYKHIRLTPNVFVASHRKKLALIRQSLIESSTILSQMRDFQMCLDVKVDSFIPLIGSLTPNDTITITKIGKSLLIDYTLVGYEFLSCKRRDMGFLISEGTVFAINRSKAQYCDILEELDKEQVQMLVVQSLQAQTKKIDPLINSFQLKEARTIFDNEVTDRINNYHAQKYLFSLNYTSMTQKRMPQKINHKQNLQQATSPLAFLTSWEAYKAYEHTVSVKPKNKNKKVELQMWLSEEFLFEVNDLIKIFELFALSNPLAKTISKIYFKQGQFLGVHFSKMESLKGRFPVKIDIPINFSLYFNLEFRGLKYENLTKEKLGIDQKLTKISRKEFQKISESKEKRAFAISAFT